MLPKFPTLRSSLLRLHFAILKIDDLIWEIDKSPKLNKLEKFVILLEDRRFLRHYGFDSISIARECFKFLTGKRNGGASTIEMQLFRTISNRYERTLRRKIREIIATVIMHRKFSKIEILRVYMKVAYMGTGLLGMKNAAIDCFPELFSADDIRHYSYLEINFEKLTDEQCAYLASMLVYPKPRFPTVDWRTKITRRSNYGLILYSSREKSLDQILR